MEGFIKASVKRQDAQLVITWEGEGLGNVAVYMSEDPDFVESEATLLANVDGNEYAVEVSKAVRVYFILKAENGARIRVAERVITMDSLTNFRDLGGYLTEDGKRTKWGKLLRSAAHDSITDDDVALLQKMGLKTVIDYRTTPEVMDHADREVEGVTYRRISPMENPNATNTLDVNQSRSMKSAEDAIAMLTGINKMLAGDAYCNSVYREVMNVVMDPAQVPFVQHCTSGKDRVGAGSATILMALGVPRETIMEDYLLSNENQVSASKLGSGASNAGVEITPEMLKMFAALTKVHKEYLEAFFATIDAKFGGTEGYLKQGLGLTDEDLARVKELYLEVM